MTYTSPSARALQAYAAANPQNVVWSADTGWTDPCMCTPTELCAPCRARGYTNPLAGYAARIYPRPVCPWCAGDEVEPLDDYEAEKLGFCRSHLAEYCGMSEAELDRGDAEQLAEYLDTLG